MTFYEWLMAQRHRPDLVGRFALKAEADLNFPVRVRKLHVLLTYYKPSPWLRTMIKLSHAEYRAYRRQRAVNEKELRGFDTLPKSPSSFITTPVHELVLPKRRFWKKQIPKVIS